MSSIHPAEALFGAEPSLPVIPTCEHFAGSEKLIGKAFGLQEKLGPIFDITMDCEDGAKAGQEKEHAEMVVAMQNSDANKFNMAGVRIHDYTHASWKQDVDIVVRGAGDKIAYITIPKPTLGSQVAEQIAYIQEVAKDAKLERESIPIHVLIETHGGLLHCREIAALPWMQVLDFGLMDFISDHQGTISANAMKSPAQFDHALIHRAKAEVAAQALAHNLIPSHNVTLDLKNYDQTLADAKRAYNEFGYQRMWSIYPTQIEAIVEAMQPDFSEVAQGCEILLAAAANNWGPIQHAGDLHDRATYRYFWQLVQRAKLAGQALPDQVSAWF